MKNIEHYNAVKYQSDAYTEVESGIYAIKKQQETLYVTSLSFIQEVEYEEGVNASDISQYPLEDILDKFYCHITDYYQELNVETSKICVLEFAAPDKEDVKNLRSIIGLHVYNKEVDGCIKLIIE